MILYLLAFSQEPLSQIDELYFIADWCFFFASRYFIAFMTHGEEGSEQIVIPLIVRNLHNGTEQLLW